MIESIENNEKTKHASQAPVTYDNNCTTTIAGGASSTVLYCRKLGTEYVLLIAL